MISAVVFDIGQTLVEYNKPLNWSKLYRPALESVAEKCGCSFSEEQYRHAADVLTRYNTRVNPRDYEVSSDRIFGEILSGTDIPMSEMKRVKFYFYLYFRQEARVFPEAEETLRALSERGISLGTLSDVAYGMDNEYALRDIADIMSYIDFPFTSNDAGYRKPRPEGLKLLADKMGVDIQETVFVGDERKDVLCAKNAGAFSVLINRSVEVKDYGQDREIGSLRELLEL